MAQPYGAYQRGYGDDRGQYRDGGRPAANPNLTSSYVDSLEWRINNAIQHREISGSEGRRLLSSLRQIQGPSIYRVEHGRASEWEIRRVSSVVSRIEAETQGYASNGREDRNGNRDGRDDRDGYRGY
jgi:hypothetical protein